MALGSESLGRGPRDLSSRDSGAFPFERLKSWEKYSRSESPSADSGQNGPGGGLTLTGETLTFTVDEATQITLSGGRDVQGTALALSDIQMGDVVTVTLGGSAATVISVRRMPAAPEATQTPSGK